MKAFSVRRAIPTTAAAVRVTDREILEMEAEASAAIKGACLIIARCRARTAARAAVGTSR